MKVLLVGEYNRAHHNIKLGLEKLGHEAKVVGLTDGFKKVEVDHQLKNHFESGILKKLRVLVLKLFKTDLLGLHLKYQLKKHKSLLAGFDILQFINEAPFGCDRKTQKDLFKSLINWNSSPFLLSCGTDYISVSYAKSELLRYSILSPYHDGKGTKRDYASALSYLQPDHLTLHKFLFQRIKGVITNDLDYDIPMQNHPKYLGMIPHAINTGLLHFKEPVTDGRIVIFHGINSHNYFKKGNDFFDKALAIIQSKHNDKVEIITTTNLPYKEYIKAFDRCHILLDQVYAYDQGFNALEAMAKGKVVFTGAEQEFLDHYNLQEDQVAINALPDVDSIVYKLDWLILNPQNIVRIAKQARAFVEEHHDHVVCARKYIKKWKSLIKVH
ncbi:MAG TPA: glycosyl transferase family 1 [Cytophagales bacterium]|jgi:hypothetical protein|nr:glycosyl transferase family 1 [Cytophagales bacterium]